MRSRPEDELRDLWAGRKAAKLGQGRAKAVVVACLATTGFAGALAAPKQLVAGAWGGVARASSSPPAPQLSATPKVATPKQVSSQPLPIGAPAVTYIDPPRLIDSFGGAGFFIYGANFEGTSSKGFVKATSVQVGDITLRPTTTPAELTDPAAHPPAPGTFRVVAPSEIQATLPLAEADLGALPVTVTTPVGSSVPAPEDPAAQLVVEGDSAAPVVAGAQPSAGIYPLVNGTSARQVEVSLVQSSPSVGGLSLQAAPGDTVVIFFPWAGAVAGNQSWAACSIEGPPGWQVVAGPLTGGVGIAGYAYTTWTKNSPGTVDFSLSYAGAGCTEPSPEATAELPGAYAEAFSGPIDAPGPVVSGPISRPTISVASPTVRAHGSADLVVSCVNIEYSTAFGPVWSFPGADFMLGGVPASIDGSASAAVSCEEMIASGPGAVGSYPLGATVPAKAAFGDATETLAISGSLLLPAGPPVSVSSIEPVSGPLEGGSRVVIRGSGFDQATGVYFGDQAAASWTLDSPTQITAIAPPWPYAGADGRVSVTVTSSEGPSLPSSAAEFAYVPASVPTDWAAVSCPSATHCVAVGQSDFGPALAYSNDGGQSWNLAAPPAADLMGQVTYGEVSCPSVSDCVAVSDAEYPRPVVIWSGDGGADWQDVTLPPPPPGVVPNDIGYIDALACSGETCVIGGQYNAYPGQVPFVDWSDNAGQTWHAATIPGGLPGGAPWQGDNSIFALSCFSPLDCVAGGGWFGVTFITLTDPYGAVAEAGWALSTTDGGRSWKLEARSIPGVGEISSLSCPSSGLCVGGAYNHGAEGPLLVYTNDFGHTWSEASLPAGVGAIEDVSCGSSSYCVAVGYSTDAKPLALVSVDAGESWVAQSPIALEGGGMLFGVSCAPNTDICEAVGRTDAHNDIVVGTTGQGWVTQALGDPIPDHPEAQGASGTRVSIAGYGLQETVGVAQAVEVPDQARPTPGVSGWQADPLIPLGAAGVDDTNPPPVAGQRYSADLPARVGGFYAASGSPPLASGAIEAWVFTGAQTTAGMNIVTSNMTGPNKPSLVLDMGTAGIDRAGPGSIGCYVDGDDVAVGVYTLKQYNDSHWHYVVCDWNGGNAPNDFSIFVDGKQVPVGETWIGSFVPPIFSPDGYRIGQGFAGYLADVAVYDGSVLSAGEVAARWQAARHPGAYFALLAASATHFWSFDGLDASADPCCAASSGSVVETQMLAGPGRGGEVELEVPNYSGGQVQGANWLPVGGFWYKPEISSIEPGEASSGGGQVVDIHGLNLTGITGVYFGTKPALSYSVISDSEVVAIAPPGPPASSVRLEVTNPAGVSYSPSSFSYDQAPAVSSVGPPVGYEGSQVMIRGANFTGVSALRFGGVEATSYQVISPSEIEAVVPSLATSGLVQVELTSPAGTSAPWAGSLFNYGGNPAAPPIVSAWPTPGPEAPEPSPPPPLLDRLPEVSFPSAGQSHPNGALVRTPEGGIYLFVGGQAMAVSSPAEAQALLSANRAVPVEGAVSASDLLSQIREGTLLVPLQSGRIYVAGGDGKLYVFSGAPGRLPNGQLVAGYEELLQEGYDPYEAIAVPYLPNLAISAAPPPSAAETLADGSIVEDAGKLYELVGGKAELISPAGLGELRRHDPAAVLQASLPPSVLSDQPADGTLLAIPSRGMAVEYQGRLWTAKSPAELYSAGYSVLRALWLAPS